MRLAIFEGCFFLDVMGHERNFDGCAALLVMGRNDTLLVIVHERKLNDDQVRIHGLKECAI